MLSKLDSRWIAFIILCLGTLMIVLDTTIVNVALPSIKEDLDFSESALAWIINAYMLTFGGFLLLGGRLSDIYGYRNLFLAGIIVFTLASLGCGVATSQEMLIVARGLQGLGGAVVSAVGFSLIMNMFAKEAERTKAMGFFGFIAAGGGSIGVLLGGFLTTLHWHWIFLVNVPIGILVALLSLKYLPAGKGEKHPHLDIAGAGTVTLSIILAVYGIVNGNEAGWLSTQTVGLLGAALALLVAFIYIESKVKSPLIPLGLFKLRNLTAANIMAVLWAAAMFTWFFISALYLQVILKYSPFDVGLAFLPANLIMAIFSVGLSSNLVMRFGIRPPLIAGLMIASLGLVLFARAPVDGNFYTDVLPSMILLGIGGGMAFNPLLLAAMNDVEPNESGLASGLVNTSFMLGGALGLAILASLAASVTASAQAGGADPISALNSGYQLAFFVGGVFAVVAAIIGFVFITKKMPKPMHV